MLNFKASNIAKAEREEKMNFFDSISKMGTQGGTSIAIYELLFIWHCGGGSDAEFDEVFAKGTNEIVITIIEGLNEAGFLGQKIDTKELKKQMEIAQQEVLQSTGATKKA